MEFCKSDFGWNPTEVDLVRVHPKNLYGVVSFHKKQKTRKKLNFKKFQVYTTEFSKSFIFNKQLLINPEKANNYRLKIG
jgi:hypothetical protein